MSRLFAFVEKQTTHFQSLPLFLKTVWQDFPDCDNDLNCVYFNSDFSSLEETDASMAVSYWKSNTCSSFQTDKYYVVFDGKLFNKQTLFQKLENNPTNVTNDAELILYLFVKQGVDVFAELEGYWSLLLVDIEKQQLIAPRDHFGNRPLFFCQTSKFLGIASRSNLLHSAIKEAKEINANAVMDYLLWGDIVKHNQHFFTHIRSLPPAHYILYSFDNQTININPYYRLPYKNCKAGYNEYEESLYIDNVRLHVLDSVRNNVENQSRLALGLSGGLDSSSILCSALKVNPDCKYTAFTFVNKYDKREESWAEKVIKQTRIDWVKVSCSAQQILDDLAKLNKVQDIPIFNASSFVQYKIMEVAKEHGFETVLDGQGGDELFGGYTAYFPFFWESLFSQWMIKDLAIELFYMKNADISCKNALTLLLKNIAKRKYFNKESLARRIKKQELDFLNDVLKKNHFASSSKKEEYKEVLNDYLFESYEIFLPNLLRWGELSAGNFGIDSVTPFANSKKMAEYVFSIPSTYKIHKGWGKYLLRCAMAGIVPDEIRWRRQKLGFQVPEQHWLQEIGEEIKKQIQDLNDPIGFLDKKQLFRKWDELYTEKNFHFQQFMFRYYSYLTWVNNLC